MIIYYHPLFAKNYRLLEVKIKRKAELKIRIFKSNPFDVRLRTHHLHGKLKNQWSFSIDGVFRILFEFLSKNKKEVVFLDIGAHEIYK